MLTYQSDHSYCGLGLGIVGNTATMMVSHFSGDRCTTHAWSLPHLLTPFNLEFGCWEELRRLLKPMTPEKVWETSHFIISPFSESSYFPRLLTGSHPFMELQYSKLARSPRLRFLLQKYPFTESHSKPTWQQPQKPEKETLRLMLH